MSIVSYVQMINNINRRRWKRNESDLVFTCVLDTNAFSITTQEEFETVDEWDVSNEWVLDSFLEETPCLRLCVLLSRILIYHYRQ